MSPLELDRRARLKDAAEHQRRHPRHSLQWIDGKPHYCTTEHAADEPHDWKPVPVYQERP